MALEEVFTDGTKLESFANRYTFAHKKVQARKLPNSLRANKVEMYVSKLKIDHDILEIKKAA